MGRSQIRNEVFRAAAKRLFPNVDVPAWGGVLRVADGGAFVETQVFAPEAEAAAEAKRIADVESVKKEPSCS